MTENKQEFNRDTPYLDQPVHSNTVPTNANEEKNDESREPKKVETIKIKEDYDLSSQKRLEESNE